MDNTRMNPTDRMLLSLEGLAVGDAFGQPMLRDYGEIDQRELARLFAEGMQRPEYYTRDGIATAVKLFDAEVREAEAGIPGEWRESREPLPE